MTVYSIEKTRASKNYYRDNFHRIVRYLLVFFLIIFILTVLIIYFAFTGKEQPYYASSNIGGIFVLNPVKPGVGIEQFDREGKVEIVE